MYKSTFVYIFGGCMRFSLSSRASVASRCFPPCPKTSMLLWSEARRCLLRALSGFCSAVLTSQHSAVSNVDEVFCKRDLSLIHRFPLEVFRCTKNGVWSFAGLHPSRTIKQSSFKHLEFCAAFKKFHICARI